MKNTRTLKKADRILTFEELKGLRAEGYIRDSTLDQRDGFGPDIQRHNEERFAESYGLFLGNRWYTEFVSGRSADKRREFQKVIEDACQDCFDVLLVDHTSRFGRNQAECIKYKGELQRLNKIVVFVSQGIISGSDRDFLSERINETLDEQYSRNLSRYISGGLAEKVEHGFHAGPPPLGYKSQLGSNRREQKVPDPVTMPSLLMALREYVTGKFSYKDVAEHLNAKGFRMRTGNPFTGYSIRDIMANRFYEGKIVYHEGLPDEKIIDGCHEVPPEVRELWLTCQQVKRARAYDSSGNPRHENHDYPFSRVLRCHQCGNPYHGEAVHYGGKTQLRLTHERRNLGRTCNTRPRSRSVDSLCKEFSDRVLAYVKLDESWKSSVIAALHNKDEQDQFKEQKRRLQHALENLRKQHLWGDITDDEYRRDRAALERQLKAISPPLEPINLPNMERAAQMLNDLPALWSHEGVTDAQREEFIQEVFTSITIDGKALFAIEPKSQYAPLFIHCSGQVKTDSQTRVISSFS
jgi:DNA invertase Pin-like site-specific DNA recombinase